MTRVARHQAGFTVVELMVVVAMVAILSTLVFVNFSGQQADDELESATQLIASDLRKVITWSQTGRVDDAAGAVPLAYGIHFEEGSNQYLIYSDFGDLVYNAFDTVVETVDLAEGELVEGVVVAACLPGAAACDLAVTATEGEITVDGATTDNLVVVLQHSGSGDTRTIQVNRQTGQISFP
jgi:prepilin-type N-terminal cleavage/methylation domain-containing protein